MCPMPVQLQSAWANNQYMSVFMAVLMKTLGCRSHLRSMWLHLLAASWLIPAASFTAQASEELPPVLVRGLRQSLNQAIDLRARSTNLVDSAFAEDIARMPDLSVADALQRVTGLQVGRDRGDSTAISIRGLGLGSTTLNGQEVFSARLGRALDTNVIPADMLAAVVVHKTSSARHVEGGLGGSLDLRTFRPFDLPDHTVIGSLRWLNGKLAGHTQPQRVALASHRWQTASGQAGWLVSLADQRRAFREDQLSVGAPSFRPDIGNDAGVIAPGGSTQTISAGMHHRRAANLVVEWKPDARWAFHAEASHATYATRQDSHQVSVGTSSTFLPGSVALAPGSSDLQRITWTAAPVSVLSFARDTVDRTRMWRVGGSWSADTWRVSAEAGRVDSASNLLFSGALLSATAPRFSQDLGSPLPAATVSGLDLQSPEAFKYAGLAYRANHLEGSMPTAQVDLTLQPAANDMDLIRVDAGLRMARRRATNAPGLIVADRSLGGLPARDWPSLTGVPPQTSFFGGQGAMVLPLPVAYNLANARDPAALWSLFGVTARIPQAGNPLSVWTIDESTDAAYVQGLFAADDQRLEVELGLRLIQTRLQVSGGSSAPPLAAASVAPVQSDYVSALPSIHLRWQPTAGSTWRLALTRAIARPDFPQLSPALSLVSNSINPSLNQGSAGNPGLRPVRTNNLDISYDRSVGPDTALQATFFAKHVAGFVTNISSPETHDGLAYQVTRPQNGGAGSVRGVELAAHHFARPRSAWVRGAGIQLNYTFCDSDTQVGDVGKQPLPNLSRHSANVIGILERGDWSARLALNWRSAYLTGFTSVVGVGRLPVYVAPQTWADLSASWRWSPRVTLSLTGLNVLNTVRRSDYGAPSRPESRWLGDTQWGLGMSIGY